MFHFTTPIPSCTAAAVQMCDTSLRLIVIYAVWDLVKSSYACMCVSRKEMVASSQCSLLVHYIWHMVHMCAHTQILIHINTGSLSHTNTHVFTFTNIKIAVKLNFRGKKYPCCENCAHRCKMKVHANFNHWEQKRLFLVLIYANWTGRCDYSLDPEFLTIESKITIVPNSFSCPIVENDNKSFLEEK